MDAIAKAPRQSFRMRGRSLVALAFCPVVPIAGWLEEIDVTLARSPGFFAGKPVVLDLSAVDLSQSAIAHLITSLEQRNIHILGIEGVDAAHLTTSMPPLLTGGRHCLLAQNEPKKPEAKPKPISLLLDSPVRSGQSIFSEGDVTVLGSVASGAEIVAGGAIHVFLALRRRAKAGFSRDTAARDFCPKIEDEMLVINGYFPTAAEINVAL